MATINHLDLPVSELHSPLVNSFTGLPSAYIPDMAGVIAVATDTNLIYRTTGTNAGDVTQIGGGDATVLETFSGAPASFSPSATDIFAVKTDVTPNQLYRTTGTGAGNVEFIGTLPVSNNTGSPVGSVTPNYVGEIYTQQDSDRIVRWESTGATNNDWVATGGTAVQSLAQPAETPAYVGQLWQVVTTATTSPFVTLTELWIGLDPTGNADTSSWHQLV